MYGQSSDTKPTDSSVEPGDLFHELDTNAQYMWDGSTWRRWATSVTLATALNSTTDSVDIPKLAAALAAGDAMANPTTAPIIAHEAVWNGASWERKAGTVPLTVLSSAARTSDPSIAVQTNANARGVELFLNVSAVSATPSIVLKVEGRDPVSLGYFNLLTSSAITAVGLYRFVIYPGIDAVANVKVNDVLTRTWRCLVEHADGDSITYSIGAYLRS